MGRLKGSTNRPKGWHDGDTESRFYDVFSRWTREDREAAMKVLGALHRYLPDKPGHKFGPGDPPDSKQQSLPETA